MFNEQNIFKHFLSEITGSHRGMRPRIVHRAERARLKQRESGQERRERIRKAVNKNRKSRQHTNAEVGEQSWKIMSWRPGWRKKTIGTYGGTSSKISSTMLSKMAPQRPLLTTFWANRPRGRFLIGVWLHFGSHFGSKNQKNESLNLIKIRCAICMAI